MSYILNFKNWQNLNESLSTTELADLKALDTIQLMADSGPRMDSQFDRPAQPETLITALGVAGNQSYIGMPTKTIEFMGSIDPEKKINPFKVKAVFFAKDGKLHATVWEKGVLTLSGEVEIKNHGGWKQLIRIGDKQSFEYDQAAGAQSVYGGTIGPVASGIMDILNNAQGRIEGDIPNAYNVPRGGSNVKWSKDSVELAKFIEAERSKTANI